jgi:hypothetical protein
MVVSNKYEKMRRKNEMHLNSEFIIVIKAPVETNNQPRDNGAWRREKMSQTQK